MCHRPNYNIVAWHCKTAHLTFKYHFPKEMTAFSSRSHIMNLEISGQITEFSNPAEMINYELRRKRLVSGSFVSCFSQMFEPFTDSNRLKTNNLALSGRGTVFRENVWHKTATPAGLQWFPPNYDRVFFTQLVLCHLVANGTAGRVWVNVIRSHRTCTELSLARGLSTANENSYSTNCKQTNR